METFKLREKDDYIKLGQLLKAVGEVSTGSEAKQLIAGEKIFVNGEQEDKRGRKLYPGDTVSVREIQIKIEK